MRNKSGILGSGWKGATRSARKEQTPMAGGKAEKLFREEVKIPSPKDFS